MFTSISIYIIHVRPEKAKDPLFFADWLKAVRATSILGLLLVLVALVMLIIRMSVMKESKPPLLVAIGTTFVGGRSFIYCTY